MVESISRLAPLEPMRTFAQAHFVRIATRERRPVGGQNRN